MYIPSEVMGEDLGAATRGGCFPLDETRESRALRRASLRIKFLACLAISYTGSSDLLASVVPSIVRRPMVAFRWLPLAAVACPKEGHPSLSVCLFFVRLHLAPQGVPAPGSSSIPDHNRAGGPKNDGRPIVSGRVQTHMGESVSSN